MNKLIYLASPFWHTQITVRTERVKAVRRVAARLLSQGHNVYAPISHNAEIADYLPMKIRHSHEFWMAVDLPFLRKCDELWVLTLFEWQLSKGIVRELEEAKVLEIPIRFISAEEELHDAFEVGRDRNTFNKAAS